VALLHAHSPALVHSFTSRDTRASLAAARWAQLLDEVSLMQPLQPADGEEDEDTGRAGGASAVIGYQHLQQLYGADRIACAESFVHGCDAWPRQVLLVPCTRLHNFFTACS
jgi:hypothetical protein